MGSRARRRRSLVTARRASSSRACSSSAVRSSQPGGIGAADTHEVAQQPRGANDQRSTDDRRRLEPAEGELDGHQAKLRCRQAGQRDPPGSMGRHRIDRHQDGDPENDQGQAQGDGQPLATPRASTAPGNRRRAASGKVCTNASAYPKARMPRGRPLPTELQDKEGRAQPGGHQRQPAVEQPGAGWRRRDPMARFFMS